MVRGTSLRGADLTSDHRHLESIIGGCTVENFVAAVGDQGKLAGYLNVQNKYNIIEEELKSKCASALEPTMDLSETTGKGPQFLKNFLDGGTTWNDNIQSGNEYILDVDAAIIPTMYENAKTTVFSTPDGGTSETYPGYFSNFFYGDSECRLGVIECCYTSTRLSTALIDNAEMCALDLHYAAKSNHIASKSFTIYDTQESDETYCSGFAYEKDSFEETVKYNSLFHMAMMTNLHEKGYVKNIPGAPLCGCVEQMPIIDGAACVKAIEGYTIDDNGNVSAKISWDDCGMDLISYYDTLNRSKMEKFIVKSKIVEKGQCAAAARDFMNERMLFR